MGVLRLAEVLTTRFLIQTEAVEDQEVEVEPVVLTFDVVHYRCTRTAAAAVSVLLPCWTEASPRSFIDIPGIKEPKITQKRQNSTASVCIKDWVDRPFTCWRTPIWHLRSLSILQ